MAGKLSTVFEILAEVTGGVKAAGNRQVPFSVTTLASDVGNVGRVVLPKKASGVVSYVPIYRYSERGNFEILAAWLPLGGYAQVSMKVDIPVSASDLTQSGTGRRWITLDLSSIGPFVLTSDQLRITTTANIADWYGPTGSDAIPTLLNSSNAVNGKIYEVGLSNPSETADVVAEFIWAN